MIANEKIYSNPILAKNLNTIAFYTSKIYSPIVETKLLKMLIERIMHEKVPNFIVLSALYMIVEFKKSGKKEMEYAMSCNAWKLF